MLPSVKIYFSIAFAVEFFLVALKLWMGFAVLLTGYIMVIAPKPIS